MLNSKVLLGHVGPGCSVLSDLLCDTRPAVCYSCTTTCLMQQPHLLLAVLMQLHLREKQELFEANAALRTVLRRQGVPDSQLEAEVKRINAQVGACCASDLGLFAAAADMTDAQSEAEVKRINAQVGAGSRCMVLAEHEHFEVGAQR